MSARSDIPGLLALDGRVALVTGSSGGIGEAVVRRLIEAGARVAAMDLAGRPCPDGATPIEADLSTADSARAAFLAFDRRFDRLDAIVHCAGVTKDGMLWKLADDDWSDVLRVNLDGSFYVLREATPRLRRNGGSVVLVTSINGERGKVGQSNYAASKAGMIGLGRTAARELGRFGIRVNLVAPGFIETGMTAGIPDEFRRRAVDESALGRTGDPDDVARAALFLVSEMARHVTGQVLRVDGGQLIG